jgi:predicted kinase
MPNLIVLVGPPGSGKSTLAQDWLDNQPASSDRARKIRISQDDQGKDHLKYFQDALSSNNGTYDILIDRMGFNKQQRDRYLAPAKAAGYTTKIIVLHENYDTCLKRCNARIGHPTIQDETNARSALATFFGKYERPTLDEADEVEFKYPELTMQLPCIMIDLDGTLAQIDHRLHFVNPPEGQKKNWAAFNAGIINDTPNGWCRSLVNEMRNKYSIVLCSGRNDTFKPETKWWLNNYRICYDELFMRPRNDSRKDDLVKEIILDFEILTRYSKILFVVDDRPSVCRKWRSRGLTVLQCQDKEF